MNIKGVESPIRVSPKSKCRCKLRNVFYDDCGFPNQSDEFDHLLHNIDGGVILRKKKHPQPPLGVNNPMFNYKFDDSLQGDKIKSKLSIDHLLPADAAADVALIKRYWAVFDKWGTFTPIWDYKCVIDTGTTTPIAVTKINYGTCETPIMRKCIAVLEKIGHIIQIHDRRWLFKALLPLSHTRSIF